MFVLGQCVYCDWLKHSQPTTPGDTANHGHFTPYLICMCISASQNILANQNLQVYNTNYAHSPMESS